MRNLIQDVRFAGRALRRTPGFTLAVLMTLALGLGANTAVFSVLSRTLLHPLPYAAPDRLVLLYSVTPAQPSDRGFVSPRAIATLQQSSRTLTGVDAFGFYSGVTYVGDRETRNWQSVMVGPGFFRALGASPVVGRLIDDRDLAPGAPPVVVLSYAVWQEEFGGDPSVVGRALRLGDATYVVAGVTPREFVSPARAPQLWIPLDLRPILSSRAADRRMLQSLGRLAPGATVTQVNAELGVLVPSPDPPAAAQRWLTTAVPVREAIVGDVRPALLVVMGAALLVLTLTCVNVAGLYLTRATARRRQLAVRAALGASRWQVVRPLIVEAIVLALMGGAIGVVLAIWGQDALVQLGGRVLPRTGPPPSIDRPVLLFAGVVSLLTGMLAGLVPALLVARGDLSSTLGASSRGAAGGHVRTGRVLVASQMALAVLLLIGGGLLGRALVALQRTDVGYAADRHVLSFVVALPARAYPDPAARSQFFSAWLERLRAIPGIARAGMISVSPWNGWNRSGVRIDGRAPDTITVPLTRVSDDYFDVVGTPVLEGRAFALSDREGTLPVAVVSERFARQWWPNASPIGARLQLSDADGVWRTIVGVVGDVRETPSGELEPGVYLAAWQAPLGGYEFLVRSDQDAAALVPSIRQALRDLDQQLPLLEPRTMAEVVTSSLSGQRLPAYLTSAFALLAAVLAVLGMYGVMAYTVSLRTREFGIRVALGGSRRAIIRLILAQGLTTAAIGTLVGILTAIAGARILGGLLHGLPARDPATFAAAAGVLLAASAAACLVPARRATRVAPMDALRIE